MKEPRFVFSSGARPQRRPQYYRLLMLLLRHRFCAITSPRRRARRYASFSVVISSAICFSRHILVFAMPQTRYLLMFAQHTFQRGMYVKATKRKMMEEHHLLFVINAIFFPFRLLPYAFTRSDV